MIKSIVFISLLTPGKCHTPVDQTLQYLPIVFVQFPHPSVSNDHGGNKANYPSCQFGLGSIGWRLTCVVWPSPCELFDGACSHYCCDTGSIPVQQAVEASEMSHSLFIVFANRPHNSQEVSGSKWGRKKNMAAAAQSNPASCYKYRKTTSLNYYLRSQTI